MARPRIIPILLIEEGRLVKTCQFKESNYVGDPLNAVQLFNDLGADELVLLDISATKSGRVMDPDLVKEIGEESDVPFSVGGGYSSLNQIALALKNGAERVILGSSAQRDPDFIRSASQAFGASTISVCIDYVTQSDGNTRTVYENANRATTRSLLESVQLAETLGAGEVIVQSVNHDGMMNGFDIENIKLCNLVVTVPVLALAGAGSYSHIKELYRHCRPSGAGCGSAFIYQSVRGRVLINYPEHQWKLELLTDVQNM